MPVAIIKGKQFAFCFLLMLFTFVRGDELRQMRPKNNSFQSIPFVYKCQYMLAWAHAYAGSAAIIQTSLNFILCAHFLARRTTGWSTWSNCHFNYRSEYIAQHFISSALFFLLSMCAVLLGLHSGSFLHEHSGLNWHSSHLANPPAIWRAFPWMSLTCLR